MKNDPVSRTAKESRSGGELCSGFPCPVILKFTKACDSQKLPEGITVPMADIQGTNCYCDEEAGQEIEARLAQLPLTTVHFLDSGNYHYLTYFWMRQIRVPFRLVLFDHHTDMQAPALGEILSCGGWVRDAVRDLPMLREIWLIGPEESAFAQAEEKVRLLTHYISAEALSAGTANTDTLVEKLIADFQDSTLPVYFSVDKDILRPEDAVTNWDQGNVELSLLLAMLNRLTGICAKNRIPALGADICGEEDDLDEQSGSQASAVNEKANRAIAELFLKTWATKENG